MLCDDGKKQKQNTLMILAGSAESIARPIIICHRQQHIWKWITAPVVLKEWLEEWQATVGR